MTAPGPQLDLARLRALRPFRHDTSALVRRIREHLDAHDGYVAVSGGKDSAAVLHLALQADPNVQAVWFDSGLEFPETIDYLTRLRDSWGVQLHRIPAEPPLLEVLHATGTWDHAAPTGPQPDLHDILITEPARKAHSRFGAGELWGVRAAESKGRRALYASALKAESTRSGTRTAGDRAGTGGLVRRGDGTVAFGPIWDWSTADVWAYLAQHSVPINPLYDKLRRIGAPEDALRVSHVIDGHRIESGRIAWLRRGWPALFNELAVVLPRLREFT